MIVDVCATFPGCVYSCALINWDLDTLDLPRDVLMDLDWEIPAGSTEATPKVKGTVFQMRFEYLASQQIPASLKSLSDCPDFLHSKCSNCSLSLTIHGIGSAFNDG